MSMGIVTDDLFEAELNKLGSLGKNSPVINGEVIDIQRGRGKNSVAVPEVLQKIIGENAIEEGSRATKTLTQALDVSDSSLSAYKNGATSTSSYNQPNIELKNHTDQTKDKILTKSRSRLLSALNHITKEKLVETKARDLAGIAKDMSAVIKNLEPEVATNGVNSPTFIVYAPQVRQESSFEVIQASE